MRRYRQHETYTVRSIFVSVRQVHKNQKVFDGYCMKIKP